MPKGIFCLSHSLKCMHMKWSLIFCIYKYKAGRKKQNQPELGLVKYKIPLRWLRDRTES